MKVLSREAPAMTVLAFSIVSRVESARPIGVGDLFREPGSFQAKIRVEGVRLEC
ncbi:hypothetical protein ACFFQW_13215 [Umezawaea endophytica]|uniref:Uncharacterized protein n=1 Tax=Umezawaea endophytica TaxID=1654476 RepID=A0A9X2VLI6_9PSEU|nr:hypothetical protein [Umezawaea endophytica]MCS7478706.1 hypothetical protein [Umezawaea endophytica]